MSADTRINQVCNARCRITCAETDVWSSCRVTNVLCLVSNYDMANKEPFA